MATLNKYWALMEDVLSGTFLFSGITLIFYETLMRYFFNSSKAWTGEVSIYLIIWGVMIGFAVALRNRRHIQIDFLYDALPPRIQKLVNLFAISVGIIFCLFFIYYGSSVVINNYNSGMNSMNANIPLWQVYLILPISGILFCIRFIEQFVYALRGEELQDDSVV